MCEREATGYIYIYMVAMNHKCTFTACTCTRTLETGQVLVYNSKVTYMYINLSASVLCEVITLLNRQQLSGNE